MNRPISPVNRLSVDLGSIAHNLRALRGHMPPGSRVAGVVKADAYGHGALPVARLLKHEGCEFLAAATVKEAISLRQAGVAGPILVLLGVWPEEAALAVEMELIPVLSTRESFEALSGAAQSLGRSALCQIKVDTGMARLGAALHQSLELLEQAAALPGLKVTGMVSHLATAGEPGNSHAVVQSDAFAEMLNVCRERGFELADSSLVGSGGTLVPPPAMEGQPVLARLGIALYGGLPSEGSAGRIDLKGAMNFKSRLLAVRHAPAGTNVSYGCTYQVPEETWLGVLPVGYADGCLRSLSNRGHVLISGRPAPIRGRVCMNLTVVDLSGFDPLPQPGDEVILLGRQGDAEITVDELAAMAGTISYEITCSLGAANEPEYLQA